MLLSNIKSTGTSKTGEDDLAQLGLTRDCLCALPHNELGRARISAFQGNAHQDASSPSLYFFNPGIVYKPPLLPTTASSSIGDSKTLERVLKSLCIACLCIAVREEKFQQSLQELMDEGTAINSRISYV